MGTLLIVLLCIMQVFEFNANVVSSPEQGH